MSVLPPETSPLLSPENSPTSVPSGTAVAVPPVTGFLIMEHPAPSASIPEPSSGLSNQPGTALVVGIGVGGLIVLVAVGVYVFCFMRNKKKNKEIQSLLPQHDSFSGQAQKYQQDVPSPLNNVVDRQSNPDPLPVNSPNVHPPSTGGSTDAESSQSLQPPGIPMTFLNSTFTYEELALATENFSSTNLLGQGGFGYVHKGVLPNGQEIAVKQLKTGSNQGGREFQAEVDTISRVHHKHLVSLVGYCISGDQRMLVYEYISNKTLEFHLHGEGRPPMSWETRLKIALGSAKGLAYLHEDCQPKVIHRDIKASNILLDNDFEVKVADFGLAKFSFDSDTHVSTRVMGTFGYLAPEYASSGKLTEKSDIFSFGVVLLEVITGRRPVDKARPFMDDSMVEWGRPLLMQALEGGGFNVLVDPRLVYYDPSEMAQMVACAAVCIRTSARRRPLMSQVVRALEGNLSAEELLKEMAPDHNRTFHGSSDYDSSTQYKDDLKKFRKLAIESQEVSTSEYSAATGEYDIPQSASSTENQRDTQEIAKPKPKAGTSDRLEIPTE